MKKHNIILWIFIIAAGSIIGNIIGDALSGVVPVLKLSESISFGPATLDLSFFVFTLGFSFSINLAGVIGIIVVILIFRKM
jgi:hypothetical protein